LKNPGYGPLSILEAQLHKELSELSDKNIQLQGKVCNEYINIFFNGKLKSYKIHVYRGPYPGLFKGRFEKLVMQYGYVMGRGSKSKL
jgi:hypothetical protein